MGEKITTPRRLTTLPIRVLKVDVIEGPDAGQSRVADEETFTVGTASGNALVLTDPTVSRYHLEMQSRPDGVLVVDNGSTNGTFAGGVRIERGVVAAGAVIEVGATRLRVSGDESRTVELHGSNGLGGLLGRTPGMRRLMAQIQRGAQSNTAVVILGESGTGKDLVARALHELGSRADAPFVTVDCGALSPTLVASELFGHERGAFTGATQPYVGAIERAHGGTLFLDEIGELPPAQQASLLGVLERRRFRRLGGRHDIDVDIRIASATHHDLRAEVNAGVFRLDLYYRIAAVTLHVPPLRDRLADLPLLIEHFARAAGHDGAVSELVPPETLEALSAYRWPGNVRELRNWVEATLALGEARLMDASPPQDGDPIARVLGRTYKEARAAILAEFEARYVEALLARAQGNVARAARLGRMDRSYLIDLVRRHRPRD